MAKVNEVASDMITPAIRYSKPELQTHLDRYLELKEEFDQRITAPNKAIRLSNSYGSDLRLSYSPSAVMFPVDRGHLKKLCGELTNEHYDREIWIFAQTLGSGPRFFVIGSEADFNGAILKLEGESCTAIGAARAVFEYPPPQLSPQAIRELSNDAVCTDSRAFGSYKKFRAALSSQHSSSPSQILTQAISKTSCP